MTERDSVARKVTIVGAIVNALPCFIDRFQHYWLNLSCADKKCEASLFLLTGRANTVEETEQFFFV
jgi:hypothetical protein